MKVLIAEDDPVSRRLLEARLVKWGYEVVVTNDGDEAWQVLRTQDAPRLAILDWMMPGMNGIDICKLIRKEDREPYTYIILLTSMQDDQDLVTGMEAGADDYITKPFDVRELQVRLRAGRRIIDLQRDLIEARERLRDRADHDALTGLWNHKEILGILERESTRAIRDKTPISVIMADLDYFKCINDTYGHLTGDAVLQTVSKRLLSIVRSYDSIGRYGGEEFLLVLPECNRDSAYKLAERVCRVVNDQYVDTADGLIRVTISIGVVCVDSEETDYKVEDLVKAADMAMYRAKNNGRNRVESTLLEI